MVDRQQKLIYLKKNNISNNLSIKVNPLKNNNLWNENNVICSYNLMSFKIITFEKIRNK